MDIKGFDFMVLVLFFPGLAPGGQSRYRQLIVKTPSRNLLNLACQ